MTLQLNGCRRVILSMSLLALMAGCQWLPPAVSPVPIHYVAIEDGVSDADLRAKAGEEVRWVNVRKSPVSVVFNGLQPVQLSCKRGFSASADAHLTAVMHPDDNASLCFSAAGRQTYRVLDAQRPGLELNHEVTVEIVPAP